MLSHLPVKFMPVMYLLTTEQPVRGKAATLKFLPLSRTAVPSADEG